jgi:hypothetical protein
VEHHPDESGPGPSGLAAGGQANGAEESSAGDDAGSSAGADAGSSTAVDAGSSAGADAGTPTGADAGAPAGQALTGEPRVDAALARLDELPDLPVSEHRAVFEHVHRSLTDVLGELDAGPLGTAGDTGSPVSDGPSRPG